MPVTRGEQYKIDRSSGARVRDIQASAREAWKEMQIPGSAAHAKALERGIEPGKLPANMSDVVVLKPAGAGAIGIETVVVIVAYTAAKDIWKYVLLPHIRARWGDRALAAKKKAVKDKGPPVQTRKKDNKPKSKASPSKRSR